MAKGKSNSAEELNIAPELEVVEGEAMHSDAEASVVEPEEITALLDEMAKQNEDILAAKDSAPNEPSTVEPPEIQSAETTNGSDIEKGTNLEVSEAAGPDTEQNQPATKAPEAGPSFTMDQILQAASSSTGFSVDQIKSFEGDELADSAVAEMEPVVEKIAIEEQPKVDEVAAVPAQEVVEAVAEEWPTAANLAAMTQGKELEPSVVEETNSAPEEQPTAADLAAMTQGMDLEGPPDGNAEPIAAKTKVAKTKKVKSESSGLKLPECALVATGVLVSIVGGYFLTSKQSQSLESKITAKVSRIDTSLAELSELVEGTNTRLANLDRALSTGEPEPQKALVNHSSPKTHVSPMSHEAPKAHVPKASDQVQPHVLDNHAASTKVVKNNAKHNAVAKKPGAIGDNFNGAAQTEGFRSGKIIIAGKSHSTKQNSKSHASGSSHSKGKKSPSHKRKLVVHSKANVARSSSIKVYLNGKAVSLGRGNFGPTSSKTHGLVAKGH